MGDIVRYNALEEKILELYVKGMSKEQISTELEIPLTEVRKVFMKPKIKEKLQEIIEYREIALKEKLLGVLDEITDKMIEEADGDISKLLRKDRDILDVAVVADRISKEQEKKRLGTGQDNIFINILNDLSGDD